MSVFDYPSTLIFSFCRLTVMFNFILHDKRKGPIWNIIMWTSLFLGQGVIICLYSQEWYAQRYCPLKEVHGAAYKNHMMYILSKDAVNFSYSE